MVKTDALGEEVGAVSMQGNQPILYFSQVLPLISQAQLAYDWELMAIVLSIQKLRHYLVPLPSVIKTNQYYLKFLLSQKEVHKPYSKWILKLLGYHFEIQYKQGKQI